jgi:hypothetical protein
MARKSAQKKIARPRVLWQVNPSTRVKGSARVYSRAKIRGENRTISNDEQNPS